MIVCVDPLLLLNSSHYLCVAQKERCNALCVVIDHGFRNVVFVCSVTAPVVLRPETCHKTDAAKELIFEKIVRAIELFNSKHKDINLRATPIRIDRNVESNVFSIPDRIRDAIRSCGLIIADLSSANINVYHEIGYAMGIAESHNMIPNIILLYKENTDHNKENKDVDKFIGFNLRNLSQLRFKEYDQLVEGLVKRLEKHYGV